MYIILYRSSIEYFIYRIYYIYCSILYIFIIPQYVPQSP